MWPDVESCALYHRVNTGGLAVFATLSTHLSYGGCKRRRMGTTGECNEESATKRVTGHDEGGMYRVKCVWDVARTGLSPIATPGELL